MDKNNKIEARFLKTREFLSMPWILSTLPPNYNSLPSTTSSNSNVLAADDSEKIKTSTRRYLSSFPSSLYEEKRNFPFRPILNNSSTTTSPWNRDIGRIYLFKVVQGMNANENAIRRRFVDSSIYKTLFEESNLTLPPSPFPSIQQGWKQHLEMDRVQDGQLRRAIRSLIGNY